MYNFLYIIKAGERNKLILYFFNACQTYLINVILIINTRHKQVYTPVLLVNEHKSPFLKFHFSLNLKKKKNQFLANYFGGGRRPLLSEQALR